MFSRVMLYRSSFLGVALAVAACSSPFTTADSAQTPDFTVRIRNASATPLTAVRVSTGPNDEVAETSIAAGQTTTDRAVHSVHTTVAITAQVYGKALELLPVEGFAGFNPELPHGRYEIVITVRAVSVPTEVALDASVVKIGQ